ncbi:hypothetical protein CR513_42660, partial [Mucuna pruriens]
MKVKRNRNGIEGLPQGYMEMRMNCHMKEGDRQTVIDILDLLIYGIVLFSHLEDYVDLVAIDIFFAIQDKNENLVLAILFDTYQERSGRSLRCCTHLCHGKCKTMCPIKDYKCDNDESRVDSWLMEAIEGMVRWHPKWNERESFIASCGGSPNIPFIGMLDCSNYNPTLTLRQNGYPMTTPPIERSTTPFIIHGRSMQDAKLFQKIRQA